MATSAFMLERWYVLIGGVVALAPLIIIALYMRARPILAVDSLGHLLFSTTWHPLRQAFGFWPFITGTLWVTGLTIVIAVLSLVLYGLY